MTHHGLIGASQICRQPRRARIVPGGGGRGRFWAKARLAVALLAVVGGVACGGGGVSSNVQPQQVQPSAQVSPRSLTFGNLEVGIASAGQNVILTNPGSVAITLTVNISGDFSQTNNCTSTLAAGALCTFGVTFTPTTTGARAGTLSVTSSGGGAAPAVSLSGTGIEIVANLSPGSLTFANQNLGTTSGSQAITLSNPGNLALTVTGITTSANFGESNNCGTSVAANASCTINVTFSPTATGTLSGTLTLTDNNAGVAGSMQTVSLQGTGTAPLASLSAPGLSFISQATGTTSAAQAETVTNIGTGDLIFSPVTISGTNASDFATSADTCAGATVTPNSACAVSVTFTPSAVGSRSASLIFNDNASDSPQTVPLSGVGTSAVESLAAPGLSFTSQATGTTSAAQTETITDTGTANLTFSMVTIGGTNASDFAKSSDTCTGAAVTPNSTCAVSVTFTPSAPGTRSASLNFSTNAVGSPQTVSLAGFGIGPLAGVYTQRYDIARTGQNTQEVYLTPSNVTVASCGAHPKCFGKLFSLPVDGQVYAEPLYIGNLAIPGQGMHNVVFVATQNDSVYAFDADGQSTAPLWQVSFLNAAAGVTTVPSHDVYPPGGGDIYPKIGITSTPVIDPATGTLYVTAKTKELQDPSCTSNCTYNYFYRLHALDITTGAEKFGGPVAISASVPGTGYDNVNGIVTFLPLWHLQRPGLLLLNGAVYIGFGSHGDVDPYHGWLMAYDATTLQQLAVFNVTPNGQRGALWQSGGGISADGNGYVYVVTANGTFDASTVGGIDYGDSVLKMQLSSGQFQVLDYFTPYNQSLLAIDDLDLGSSPGLILPDQPGAYPHLLATGGKDGRVWLINRDNLGHIQLNDAGAVQVIADGSDSLFGGLSYWNSNLYVQEVGDYLKQFSLLNGVAQTPINSANENGGIPNSPPAISANGTINAVLWFVQTTGFNTATPAVLYAFDPTDVSNAELYDSTQASSKRDQAGPGVKFVVPTVANGKVYVGASGEVDVYGLLP